MLCRGRNGNKSPQMVKTKPNRLLFMVCSIQAVLEWLPPTFSCLQHLAEGGPT